MKFPHLLIAPVLLFLGLLASCTSGAPYPYQFEPREIAGLKTQVPIQLAGDPMAPISVVEAEINGATGIFLIDTGASQTILSMDFCRRAHLPHSNVIHIKQMRMGAVTFRDFDVVCEGLNPHQHFDGILGSTLLLKESFTLNAREQYATWGEAGSGQAIDVRVAGGTRAEGSGAPHLRVTVPGKLDGYHSSFVIDTGSSLTMVNKSMFELTSHAFQHLTRPEDHPLNIHTVHGTEIHRDIYYLKNCTLALGDREPFDIAVALIVAEDGAGGNTLDILGFDVLRQFVVTIDAAQCKLYLTPLPQATKIPTTQPVSMTGPPTEPVNKTGTK